MKKRIGPRAAFVISVATLTACGGHAVDLGTAVQRWRVLQRGTSSSGELSSSGGGQSSGGGASADVLVGRQNGAVEVFVDDQRVYWLTEPENDLAPQASLRSCLKDQCAATVAIYVTATNGSNGYIDDVGIDGTSVYRYLRSPASSVQSCPRAGCGQGPSTVVSNIDETSLASDGTFFYWASGQETFIFQCSPDNCRATQRALAQAQDDPSSLVVSQGYAYWIKLGSPREIVRVATDGLSPVETIVTGQNVSVTRSPALPPSLSVREPYVYFTNSDSSGLVLRCPVTGCPSSGPTVVASMLSVPTSVVADETKAYWINVGGEGLTADGSLAACAVTGCGTRTTTLAFGQTFWVEGPAANIGAHSTAIDSQYVYWVASGPREQERAVRFPRWGHSSAAK